MATKKCTNCGGAVGQRAKYCKNCAHPVNREGEEPAAVSEETLNEESVDRLDNEAPEEPSLLPPEDPSADSVPPESPARADGDAAPADTAAPQGFTVEVANGLSGGTRADLNEGSTLLVGAGDGMDLQIGGDPGVSRQHLSFEVRDGVLFVRDEGSTNGTFVHVTRRREIGVGDSIVMGGTLLKIKEGV